MKRILGFWLATTVFFAACSSDETGGGETQDNFDRKALLENVADNIIVPAYQSFAVDMTALSKATTNFTTTPDLTNLVAVQEAWLTAYETWQTISFFEIGKAEEVSFRNFMNVYPVNASDIDANIAKGAYDLTAVSLQDEQGFGAVDYLLYGIGATATDVLGMYTDVTNGAAYRKYLADVVSRMQSLTTAVVTDWSSGYRDTFIANNAFADASGSLDKLVNDYVFHYEKHLRAGKVGIPAGIFSSGVLPNKVEAFYKGDVSKQLFLKNLQAMQDFFNGVHIAKSGTGESLKTYLAFLSTLKGGGDLSILINDQFDTIRAKTADLDVSFTTQITTDNTSVLSMYSELQKNVVLLKVDMLQAMTIAVGFVDADGD